MIYISDLQQLLSQWTGRMGNPAHSPAYHDALSECIFELSSLVSKAITEELTYQDFLDSQAQDYLSSLEAHDRHAA